MSAASAPESSLTFRYHPTPEDRERVRHILVSSGFFYDFEVAVAIELIDDWLVRKEKSDYHFIFADQGSETVGYVCYGPICMAAAHRFDLYWIGVSQSHRNGGIGKKLMAETEKYIRQMDGRFIYVETSSRAIYESTRQFYLRQNYAQVAQIPHYYGDDDHRVVFMKDLHTERV